MSNNNNIENQEEDLKGLAPHLFKVTNNAPFKANEDYFENFTSKPQNEIVDYEEIKNEAPVLSAIPKYNPFTIPADYFEYLPSRVQQNVLNAKQSFSFIDWLLLLIKPRFAVPFIATVFITVAGINFMNKNGDTPKAETAEEITTEEQLYNIDESTILESLYANQNEAVNSTSADEGNIQNYLMDNNIDESNLNYEL